MIPIPGWIRPPSWTQCHSLLWREAGGEGGWQDHGGENYNDDDDDDDGDEEEEDDDDDVLWKGRLVAPGENYDDNVPWRW